MSSISKKKSSKQLIVSPSAILKAKQTTFCGLAIGKERSLMSEDHFESFISVKDFRERFACIKCSSLKGFTLDRGGVKNADGKYQRRLKFQCCQASCSYGCYSSSIKKFCKENDINLDGSLPSPILNSPPSVIGQEPASGLELLSPFPSKGISQSDKFSFPSPKSSIPSSSLSTTPELPSQNLPQPTSPSTTPSRLAVPSSESKRRKIHSLDSGSDEGENDMMFVGLNKSNASYMTSMMKSMVSNFANEMKNQLITEIGSVIGHAIASQNQQFQDELNTMKEQQDVLFNMITELQKKPPTPPSVSYASVTSKVPSTSSTTNGRKSPVLRQPRQVDATKFMKSDADGTLFSERVAKLRQSSMKAPGSTELVTLYALRVRDIQPKEIRDTLKQTTFNPRVIKDISYASRNTMAFTIIKSSLPMLQDILHGLFGWTTTLTFDPSKTFNPNAPDEIKDQVRSGSIRTYAKYLFRAEFIAKDPMLLEHHMKFVQSKGQEYANAVSDFVKVIKRTPTSFFPTYVPATDVPTDNVDGPSQIESTELNGIQDDKNMHNEDAVTDMSICVDDADEDEATEKVLQAPETAKNWADETLEESPEINVEYEQDVPADADASPSC
jgi:hypothetical protein